MKSISLLTLIFVLGACAHDNAPETTTAQETVKSPSRKFMVNYMAEATELPKGGNLRLWIPIPSDDDYQTIHDLKVRSPLPWTMTTEPVHGNRMIYIDSVTEASRVEVKVSYLVDRIENTAEARLVKSRADEQYLRPGKLTVINDEIREIEQSLTGGEHHTRANAKKFYDHVLNAMSYGKPADKPWGKGDTVYACEEGVGNCTDFHSYFISLCRTAEIPARFQIGLYGKYDAKPAMQTKTGGYHCWAEFQDDNGTWVPVDISEADKAPEKTEYFFGNHTDNRVTLSIGRDLTLAPAQVGPELNYFVYPYAEVDGVVHSQVSKTSYWTDL